jgi:hypothetical protein
VTTSAGRRVDSALEMLPGEASDPFGGGTATIAMVLGALPDRSGAMSTSIHDLLGGGLNLFCRRPRAGRF